MNAFVLKRKICNQDGHYAKKWNIGLYFMYIKISTAQDANIILIFLNLSAPFYVITEID